MRHHRQTEKKTRILACDIDGTLLDGGLPTAGLDTIRALVDLKGPQLVLVYATGRSLESTFDLISRGILPRPHAIAANVGTEIWINPFEQLDAEYQSEVKTGYSRERVVAAAVSFSQITLQPDEFQSPIKASFYLEEPEMLPAFEELLCRSGAHARVVYSGNKFLDVIPHKAGKRNAVDHMRRRLRIRRSRVLVAGDSGNDLDMLADPEFLAVAVGNAKEELDSIGESSTEHQSRLPHAAGVLEGAEVFGFWS